MKRRRFLIGAGVTTSVAVTGCLGEDEPSDGDAGSDDSEPADEEADDGTEADAEKSNESDENDADDGPDDADDNSADDSSDEGAEDESTGDDSDDGDAGDEDGEEAPDDGDRGDDSDDGDGSDGDGGDGTDAEEPETYALRVELGVEPGYSRPAPMTVAVGDRRVETDDAVVSFDLEAGSHTLEAAADGFVTETRTVELEGDTTVQVELARRYEDIRFVDHDVSITRRDDADDTVDARAILENRSDFQSTEVWLEAWATDQHGESFGYGESQDVAVPPGERREVSFKLLRSADDSFEEGRRVDGYEMVVLTTGTFRTLDHVQSG